MNKENKGLAVLEVSTKAPPSLKPGDVDPEITRRFENACRNFFYEKGVKEEDQVKRVLNASFHDNRMIHWVDCNRATFEQMKFPDFMVEFRSQWLDTHWSGQIDSELRVMRQNKRPFREWYMDFYSKSLLLKGTPDEMSDKELRKLVYSLLDAHLKSRAEQDRFRTIVDLKAWSDALALEDRSIRTEAAFFRSSKAPEGHSVSGNGASSNNTGRRNRNSATADGRVKPPPLTADERELLKDHDGCFVCREFYIGHKSDKCLGSYPDGSSYRELTVNDARTAATKRGKAFNAKSRTGTATSGTKGKGKSVAAATIDEAEEVEEVGVAALADALNYDSESDVSVPPRLSAPSLHWQSLVWDADNIPSLPASCLLDCGSQLVLVSEDFVRKNGLATFALSRPVHINVAIPEVPDSALQLSAKDRVVYRFGVSLTLSSSDNRWSSKEITAVLVPTLLDNCDIILGLPWLSSNGIVMDFENRSAIAKASRYDLLRPPVTSAAPRKPASKWTRRTLSQLKRNFRDMLLELQAVVWRRNLTSPSEEVRFGAVAAISSRIVLLNEELEMAALHKRIMEDYADVFGPVPHVDCLPEHEPCRVRLKSEEVTLDSRSYPSPRKYREAWTKLIGEHVAAGRIVPSSSQHSSPAFLVPKADPSADPRLVVDYRKLNMNVVPDSYPLPNIPDIFSDCSKGRFWCKFDMTNSFFQTRVHPDDQHLFAMNTPIGAFDWTVMPMGFRNAPSIHQRRMTVALREHIRKICHVFIDDCIGWSDSVAAHEVVVRKILDACRANGLFLNARKSVIITTSVTFLGHRIDRDGIHADTSKTDKIVNWPVPRSVKDVRAFLGLVRYLSAFLPSLAEYTAVLDPLTSKTLKNDFPVWTPEFQTAFDAIKKLAVSSDCLTFIDHENPGENKIFVTTDASNVATGAVLSFGPTWESARPVAFESKVLNQAERRYPVHEKEMLAVVRALKKWRSDLLGMPFFIYTDHRTLQFFEQQRDLSQRQARWMEFLCQYDGKIVYVKGDENVAADALSRTVFVKDSLSAQERAQSLLGGGIDDDENCAVCLVQSSPVSPLLGCGPMMSCDVPVDEIVVAATSGGSRLQKLAARIDDSFLGLIRDGYKTDPWCQRLSRVQASLPGLTLTDGLWFIGERLVIPQVAKVRAKIFHLAHDMLGHFGLRKSYGALRDSFYWPNMRSQLETLYLRSCDECQRNKDRTTKVPGPLHPLPVPTAAAESIAMDFVGPLPEDGGMNCVLTVTDRLGSDIRLIACRTTSTAEEVASLFFQHWYCENGLPSTIVSDRDRLFVSRFWKTLHRLSGVKLAMSSSFHPQTDGSSERTNKSVIQAIRYHIEKNQKGWVSALHRVRFALMNTVNASTGFSPFQIRLGRSPRLVPAVLPVPSDAAELKAIDLIRLHEIVLFEAQDNLLAAKVDQAFYANKKRGEEVIYSVGDRVLLSSRNRRKELKAGDPNRVTKFLPRWIGPYTVVKANPNSSTYTLDLPGDSNIFPVFHGSLLKRYHENDDTLVPTRAHLRPPPLKFDDGSEEYFIEKILDEHKTRRLTRYLVRWKGYGPEDDLWIPEHELEGTDALKSWKERSGS